MSDKNVSYDLMVKGIITRMRKYYPVESFRIYDNKVIGDMETPCFVIHAIQILSNKIRPNRYKYIYTMDIRYYSDKDKNLIESDMNNIAVEMQEVLSLVHVDDILLKIENDRIYCEKEDDVLHCFVNYIHEASNILEEDPTMQDLGLNAKTKEEE